MIRTMRGMIRTMRGMMAMVAGLGALASAANAAPAASLAHWSPQARARIEAVIASAPAGSYAVFDADNTLWQHDLEESLLPFMEARGELSVATLDPALKPVPIRPGESLYGYYLRLCEIDDNLCYPWIAQVFSGHSLASLKRDVDDLMARHAPIPVRYQQDGKTVSGTVERPHIFAAQRELIAALKAGGVHVYVVTAASEELARMVLSDPRYGLDIAPADVIGVTMLLRDPVDGSVTTARRQIAQGHFGDSAYPMAKHMRSVMTPTLWSPETWYEGKVAGIRTYIDPVRAPLLAAGDSPSDWAMLFQASALRIWVNRNAQNTARLGREQDRRADEERQLGKPVALSADKGWLVVTQPDLAPGD